MAKIFFICRQQNAKNTKRYQIAKQNFIGNFQNVHQILAGVFINLKFGNSFHVFWRLFSNYFLPFYSLFGKT